MVDLLRKVLTVFIISMLPVVELRGGILWGAAENLPFWINYLACVAGNLLPVPFLLIFARKILNWLATWKRVGHIFQAIIDKAEEKAKQIETLELTGLYAFVAIPLPGTGAWTGTLIATALRMRFLPSFLVICAGVMTSGIIMGIVSLGVFGFLGIF